jgi:bisphosphoglycerate-independent phosphoglycerate mutase (AlkP superfamily)
MTEFKKTNLGTVVLLLLDGWGITISGEGNAIAQARTPIFKELAAKYPATILSPSHLNIAKKKLSVAANFQTIGTGKIKATKNDFSIFDYFDRNNLKWLVLTDPEKLAYSTFYLNNKKKAKPENYQVFPSQPSLTINSLTSELLKKIKSRKTNFITAVYSNLDLAAHSGDFQQTVAAVEIIDRNLNKIAKTVLDNSGVLIITSSHGNAEEAIEMQTELKNTKDTDNPVPFIMVGRQFEGKSFGFQEAPGGDLSLVQPSGSLLDLAPTILKIFGLEVADKFDGKPLI